MGGTEFPGTEFPTHNFMLQCVIVCCSVLHCTSLCCSVLHSVAMCSLCWVALSFLALSFQHTIKLSATQHSASQHTRVSNTQGNSVPPDTQDRLGKLSDSVCWERYMTTLPHRNMRRREEVGGWGRVPFSRNLMSPTPRRKWYLTTGRRFH